MPEISRRLLLVATLLACTCLTGSVLAASQSDSKKTDRDPPLRLAVIGASASAGFGVVVEVEKKRPDKVDRTEEHPDAARTVKRMVRLVDLIGAADHENRLIELDLSSHMFFTNPFRYGSSSVKRALAWKPDVVFAVDFLFWYVFGNQPEETRVETLKQGLKELERLASTGIPMVIGTVPDLFGVDSFVISEEQIPSTNTTMQANRMIEAWADERANVVVAPIFELTSRLASGEPIEIGPHIWHPRRDGLELIAPDGLHPTYEGLICIAQAIEVELRALDTTDSTFPELRLDQATLKARMKVLRRVEVAP